MVQEGNGRSNAHHGFTNKGEDSKKGNRLGIKMHHMDLIMRKPALKKAEKGGTRPAHRASMENRTSVTILSMEAWDAGQTIVLPHSLKLEASAGRIFSKASRLSTSDRPTAGLITGDELDEERASSPSLC